MPTLKAGTSNNRGFTFIEISVVLVIVAIVAATALPRMISFLASESIKESSSRIASYLEHVRDESVYKRKAYLFTCDFDKNTISAAPLGEEDKAAVMLRPFKLPEDVRIIDIAVRGKGKLDEGETTITFYPGGISDGAYIHLRDKNDRDLTLEISPFTRQVKIHEGYADAV